MDKQKVLYFQKETQQEKKIYILEYLECSEGSTLLKLWYPQVHSVVQDPSQTAWHILSHILHR